VKKDGINNDNSEEVALMTRQNDSRGRVNGIERVVNKTTLTVKETNAGRGINDVNDKGIDSKSG